jgi:hypothetical protein
VRARLAALLQDAFSNDTRAGVNGEYRQADERGSLEAVAPSSLAQS